MPFDTLALAALRDELEGLLLDGRVQRVVRPSELSLGIEVYAGERHQLWLSAESDDPGIALLNDKPRRGVEAPSPLQLLLRKHVRGSRITSIAQPDLERMLTITFLGSTGSVSLHCEIMGRLSNLILVGADGAIMGVAKPVPASVNRYRTILPTYRYVAPPPQEKEHPRLLTEHLLTEMLIGEDASGPLWRRLLRGVAGVSPTLAQELVFRVWHTTSPDPGAVSAVTVRALVREISSAFGGIESGDWEPCVAPRAGDEADDPPSEFAPYWLSHLPSVRAVPTMVEAVCTARAAAGQRDPYRRVRERLRGEIAQAIARLEARRAAQQDALVSDKDLAMIEFKGNALLALGWGLKPGATKLQVNSVDLGGDQALLGRRIVVDVDPALSPVENAQVYFSEYRKRQAAAKRVPALLAQTELHIRYAQQALTDVDLAETRPELDAVRADLAETGLLATPSRKRHSQGGQPLTFDAPDGTPILVGRNSRQNDLVTFRRANPNDLWLHAHGVPGGHVIVKTAGRPIVDDTLLMAAALAARYSAARREARIQVDYAERRHVRQIKGAPPGMVTYTHEDTIVVAPATDEELRRASKR